MYKGFSLMFFSVLFLVIIIIIIIKDFCGAL